MEQLLESRVMKLLESSQQMLLAKIEKVASTASASPSPQLQATAQEQLRLQIEQMASLQQDMQKQMQANAQQAAAAAQAKLNAHLAEEARKTTLPSPPPPPPAPAPPQLPVPVETTPVQPAQTEVIVHQAPAAPLPETVEVLPPPALPAAAPKEKAPEPTTPQGPPSKVPPQSSWLCLGSGKQQHQPPKDTQPKVLAARQETVLASRVFTAGLAGFLQCCKNPNIESFAALRPSMPTVPTLPLPVGGAGSSSSSSAPILIGGHHSATTDPLRSGGQVLTPSVSPRFAPEMQQRQVVTQPIIGGSQHLAFQAPPIPTAGQAFQAPPVPGAGQHLAFTAPPMLGAGQHLAFPAPPMPGAGQHLAFQTLPPAPAAGSTAVPLGFQQDFVRSVAGLETEGGRSNAVSSAAPGHKLGMAALAAKSFMEVSHRTSPRDVRHVPTIPTIAAVDSDGIEEVQLSPPARASRHFSTLSDDDSELPIETLDLTGGHKPHLKAQDMSVSDFNDSVGTFHEEAHGFSAQKPKFHRPSAASFEKTFGPAEPSAADGWAGGRRPAPVGTEISMQMSPRSPTALSGIKPFSPALSMDSSHGNLTHMSIGIIGAGEPSHRIEQRHMDPKSLRPRHFEDELLEESF